MKVKNLNRLLNQMWKRFQLLKDKQDKIAGLEARVRTDRTAHKREEGLVVSAIYDLGQRVIEANLTRLHNPNQADDWGPGADPDDDGARMT